VKATEFGALAAGHYRGTVDFGVGGASLSYTSQSSSKLPNGFIRAFADDGHPLWTRVLPGDYNVVAAVDAQQGIGALVGLFSDTVDLSFGDGQDSWSSPGLEACYVIRFPLTQAVPSSPPAVGP
jgi:hypothetical protein